nr:tube protein [Altica viridicyanea]
MDPSLEIRKLLPSQIRELASILETHELWKRLMTIIPKTLEKNNYQCDVNENNRHKYNSEHFKLIENESDKSRKTCTEILFDEWGTSGRIRPALGHLLYLLTKANLFRAADYVAVDLLHQEKPKRPNVGPEAEIPVNLSEIVQLEADESFERVLDEINYVSNAVNLIRTHSDKVTRKASKIPEIVITPEINEEIVAPSFNVPVVKPVNKEVSDMIKFSTTQTQDTITELNSAEIPAVVNDISVINNCDSEELNLPNISLINNVREDIVQNTVSTISNIYTENSEIHTNIPENTVNSQQVAGDNIPNLSILNLETGEESSSLPDFEALQSRNLDQSDNIPDLSALQTTSLSLGTQSLAISNSSNVSSDSSLKSRTCSSPLPNLSLDTILPHFNYQNLEIATNNFNTEQYQDSNLAGRLLGKGEFGSVFLALNLSDKPIAVKKLDIGDVEIVNVDDEVTKQFRCEVEVLSKYKHENLLSLLGYSCNGSTYCLLYEYMPGGALKDRLQDENNKLVWQQRLNIAYGTSKAISYLHTAFSTPLIHRDIKSANILLDSQNNPKLGDFGLIKLIPNQNISTATTVFGTSAYMPREAFGGDISVKLDTFSFGVVLLELLTSLLPIDNNRDGPDLVTHIGETIENNDITPILDQRAGSWKQDLRNYGQELFNIAQDCLEEKKKRPTMSQVTIALNKLTRELNFNFS